MDIILRNDKFCSMRSDSAGQAAGVLMRALSVGAYYDRGKLLFERLRQANREWNQEREMEHASLSD